MATQESTDEVAAEELTQAAEFRVALRRFLRGTEDQAAGAGLTPQRYDLLLQIHAAPRRRLRIRDLVEVLQLSQSTVTELVQRAEDSGLLVRERSEDDRRACVVRLTEEGERRFLRAFLALRGERQALVETFRYVDPRVRRLTRSA